MRIKNTFKNSAFAIVSYAVMCALTLVIRKLFIIYLPSEYLGYEGLFSNVFSLLALADLGVETIIIYRLYPALANKDEKEVYKIISIYRYLYKIVGIFILIVGIIMIPILPYMVKDGSIPWSYMICIYLMQLAMTLCTYLLAYKRLMFIASQQEYKCQIVDTACFLGSSTLKILILMIAHNYIIYLAIGIINNIVSNAIIYRKVDTEYPYLKQKTQVTISQLKENGILSDLRHNITQKVAGTIYGATDNIVVSAIIGIQSVAVLSNYLLISGYVTTAFDKILHPFQAAIGDKIYSDKEQSYEIFSMFDRFSFLIAIVLATVYFCVLNPFLTLWLGENFIFPKLFILFFSLNQYILWNHKFLVYYRASFGHFEIDKIFIALGAILNVVLSLALAKIMGISGIMLGTMIGHMGFWVGRVKAVFTILFPEYLPKYIGQQIIKILALISSILLSNYICNVVPFSSTIWGLIGQFAISSSLSILIWLLFSLPSAETKLLIQYVKRTILEIKK